MNWIELIAVAFGIVAVYFNARQNVLGWPTGIVNVALFTLIFYQGKLYALMGLQVVFFAISVYGWYQWLRGGDQHQGVKVTRTPIGLGLALIAVSGLATAGLGWVLAHYTEDRQPFIDAGVSVISMAAQWMMARKYFETWIIWVAVNVISVPLFVYRHEYPTALQYAVFLGLAINGLVQWRRELVRAP